MSLNLFCSIFDLISSEVAALSVESVSEIKIIIKSSKFRLQHAYAKLTE